MVITFFSYFNGLIQDDTSKRACTKTYLNNLVLMTVHYIELRQTPPSFLIARTG